MFKLFLIFLVIEEAISRIRRTFFSPTHPAEKIYLKPLTRTLLVGYLFLFFGSLIYHFIWVEEIEPWLSVAGAALFGAGVWLRNASIRTLGPYWSFHTEIKKEHRLVRQGPFASIRHPYSLAVLFELTGFALLANAWPFFFLTLTVQLPLLWYRNLKEEKILLEHFQDQYRDYTKGCGAFFPKLFKVENE